MAAPHPTRSWVKGANDPHGFGLTHLPYGAFHANGSTRLCVRIGEWLLDLAACADSPVSESLPIDVRRAMAQPTLNALLALGPPSWQTLREWLISILSETAPADAKTSLEWFLHRIHDEQLALPLAVGNYTDFYASLHHARRVGEIFRPGNPLLPNYKHIPIGYHGRASSIVVSGTGIRRPWGQSRPATEGAAPTFAPTAALDYEAELALIVGTGNPLGQPIPVAEARKHLFGVALLNDWSARDIQSWEYQPLGPFLGKNFATTLSPWITPLAALEAFRVPARPRPKGDPEPLPYLFNQTDQASGALDIQVATTLSTAPLSTTNTRELYWTPAQLIAHHTSNGCNLQAGDILATGTLSGPDLKSAGCLLEHTQNGTHPITLPNGEQRAWLADGDEITLTATCERPGTPSIQLGTCTARVLPALT
uniref:fumarylacetoacetase n=1 Tax=uncultured bacterium 162 TaxID=698381 RepID=E3T759_9BACT|nr:fumarylacetoacetase [uncultured bacterium 162]